MFDHRRDAGAGAGGTTVGATRVPETGEGAAVRRRRAPASQRQVPKRGDRREPSAPVHVAPEAAPAPPPQGPRRLGGPAALT
jgi:hypothetical protein